MNDFGWRLSSSSAREALDLVDGTGPWEGHGPHYSRRTPGSKTFTGVGPEIVLVREDAVWAVILNKTPIPRGSGTSRGRGGEPPLRAWVWRNNMFRNLGPDRSSDLIRTAVAMTARKWVRRYGALPAAILQTEVQPHRVASDIPGYCYRRAGWVPFRRNRQMIHLRCPQSQLTRALELTA